MKKIVLYLLTITLTTLGACNHKPNTTTGDSDTVIEDTSIVETPQDEPCAVIEMTQKGVFNIKPGIPTSSIPESIEGFYNKVSYEPETDFGPLYELSFDGSSVASLFADDSNKKIEGIEVYTPKVYVTLKSGKKIWPGMSLPDFAEAADINVFEYNEMTGVNVVIGAYNFGITCDLTPEADSKMDRNTSGRAILRISDFAPSAIIYSIGLR